MEKPIFTKSITFDKEAQNALPKWVKDKMKADREAARRKMNCKHKNTEFVGAVGGEFCHDCQSWTGVCD